MAPTLRQAQIVSSSQQQSVLTGFLTKANLGNVLDDLHELVQSVTVSPSEFDELLRLLDDRSTFRRPDDGDAPATAELQKSLVAK